MSSLPKKKFRSGQWVVLLLLSACVLGTGITWWNYSGDQMLSTRNGMVTKTRLVTAVFPTKEKRKIQSGMLARVTTGSFFNPAAYRGRVTTIIYASDSSGFGVDVLLDEMQPGPPIGIPCRVSVDTSAPIQIP